MGGITTGIGLFSGIDSASLIDQLIASQSRPQILAQRRVIQLKSQQAAYLDINSRLNAFKTAAASFRVNNIFSGNSIASSNESILTATASSAAVPGSYNFVVDRLVTTQQLLTRGFADSDSSTIGLGSLTFESTAARLDADTALADLNGGNGITRGKININGIEVDLSRVGTVQEVLDAVSEVPGVTARVENDRFVFAGVTTMTEESGAGILSSLGLSSYNGVEADQVGTSVFSINANTSLQSLNDGRGVEIRDTSGLNIEDFIIAIDTTGDGIPDTDVSIRIGEIEEEVTDDEGETIIEIAEGAVSTVGGVVDRINSQLSDAGYSEFTASINTTTGAIDIVDSSGRNFDVEDYSNTSGVNSAASDLGIAGSFTGGTASGTRILAGMNTKLVASLNGGTGLTGTDGDIDFDLQDGTSFSTNLDGLFDINDIINTINADSITVGGFQAVTASINAQGTGIQIVDNTTANGIDSLTISGGAGADTAAALGIAGTFSSGVAAGENLQLAYLGEASLLSELNNGQGIGTGKFEISDTYGNIAEINITSSATTLGDVIKSINSGSGLKIIARINDNGDGIVIEEDNEGGASGGGNISITNTSGTVASKLGIEGTSDGVGALANLDGSFEKVIDFDPDATLSDIRDAINAANIGVSASIINTGTGTTPFRLNLTSERTGFDGRFLIDSGNFDLGVDMLDEGNDARVFYGSTDPASGVLLSSSTNQLDGVVQGVSIDLLSRSDDAVTLSVTTNVTDIETKITEFVAAFNGVIEGIDFRTRYNNETEERGILLGDGTLISLKNSMYAKLNSNNDGFSNSVDSLTQVGITVGKDSVIEFDVDKFREAYAEDPEGVEDLFTRQTLDSDDDDDVNTIDEPFFSELSVLGQFEEFAESYVTSIGGVLRSRTDAIDSQIKIQEDRIESLQLSLDNKRVILQRQFLAMEQAIGAFQTQGASLGQLSALG